jgi:hypothetical protein
MYTPPRVLPLYPVGFAAKPPLRAGLRLNPIPSRDNASRLPLLPVIARRCAHPLSLEGLSYSIWMDSRNGIDGCGACRW